MKKDILYILTILTLLIMLTFSIQRCTSIEKTYNQNLIAMNDSIHVYKTKNGQLVRKTLSYETDLKTLNLLNSDLYDEISKLKGKITSGTHFTGIITNTQHDTTYVVKTDTVMRGFSHDFAFNDDFRTLEGNIQYVPDTAKVRIMKDEVKFDYTVALDSKNNIHITSKNPYVKFNEISGFTLPKQRVKRWSVGPSVSFGYDPVQNRPAVNIGISLNYGLIRW